MSRRSLISFLPSVFMILSTSLGFAEQTASSNSPTAASLAPATVLTNSTISTTAVAAVPAGMQAPSQQTPVTERSSYNSIHVDGPYIAMTFDDGPDAKLTPRLLDILKERHIHATFFVLGERVKDHPEILEREIAEGHEVGNHSWDHKALNKLAEGGLQHELADTSELIKQTVGKPVTLMRPPYGATNPRLSRAIEKEYGMKVILWSVDPDDWKDPGASVVSSRILNGWKQSAGTKPGAIILSHDIHKGTIEAMPATLDALLAKGYKFVTVSELLALESKNPAPAPNPSAQKTSKSKKNQS
jgi:peptidoglycan-N-acetylglucosamine deacetylase